MANVSVLMGVYREPSQYLESAIDSILAQAYTDFEFIIVLDDPDNLQLSECIKEYMKRDRRIVFIQNEYNMGLALSLNCAIKASTGKYLARMDADDISLPDRFSKQVSYLDLHPDVAVVGTNKIIIDEAGKEISRGGTIPTTNDGIRKVLRYSNIMVHPSVMMRSDAVKSVGGYRAFPTTQDYDLWSRLLESGYCLNNMDEYLICYRINTAGISMSKAYKQFVVGKYMERLERERRETGTDSFSIAGLNRFMQDKQVDNPETCRIFQEARALFEDGRYKIKKGEIISGGITLLKAARMHPYMREAVVNQIKSAFAKKKCD